MTRPKAWFGADPGGANAFGVALLHDDATFDTHVVSCADEAVEWLIERKADISAAAIDAPLWWSSGKGGDRMADCYLRKTYKISAGTVQAMNSLRGAALVQGVMLAIRLRERLPPLSITEAHPKALLKALKIDTATSDQTWRDLVNLFGLRGDEPNTEHERDAVLAAVAAREGSADRCVRDLARDQLSSEQDPATVPWGPVHYWWPRTPRED